MSFSAASQNPWFMAKPADVVQAVGERDDLVVGALLAELLHAAVQVADLRAGRPR